MLKTLRDLLEYRSFAVLFCILMLLLGAAVGLRTLPAVFTEQLDEPSYGAGSDTEVSPRSAVFWHAICRSLAGLGADADNIVIDKADNSWDNLRLDGVGTNDKAAGLSGWFWRGRVLAAVPMDKGEAELLARRPQNQEPDSGDGAAPYLPPQISAEEQAGLDYDHPQVALYSTHSSETYVPNAGVAKVTGKNGGVYQASLYLKDNLAKYGIVAVVDPTINDYPDWSKSYANSLDVVRSLMQKYNSLDLLIDMHRDAGVPKDMTTVEINGKKAARIMLVVGTAERMDHPNWRQNLEFAQSIGKRMEEMYPGLLRQVRQQNGRYNQHVSTHAILIEMGATENSLEEVKYSCEMLAEVLASVMQEKE